MYNLQIVHWVTHNCSNAKTISDQSLHCPHEESTQQLPIKHTSKTDQSGWMPISTECAKPSSLILIHRFKRMLTAFVVSAICNNQPIMNATRNDKINVKITAKSLSSQISF